MLKNSTVIACWFREVSEMGELVDGVYWDKQQIRLPEIPAVTDQRASPDFSLFLGTAIR